MFYVHNVAVAVADQEASLDFFINTIGCEKAMDMVMGEGARWITVVPPGAATQLSLMPTSWFTAEKMPSKSGIAFGTDDVEGMYAMLTARGVKFKHPPMDMPWGAKATFFYDLDDNEFFLSGV